MKKTPTFLKGKNPYTEIVFNREKTVSGCNDKANHTQFVISQAPKLKTKRETSRHIGISDSTFKFTVAIKDEAVKYIEKGHLWVSNSYIGQFRVYGPVRQISFRNVKGYVTEIQNCESLMIEECNLGKLHLKGEITHELHILRSTFDEITCESPIVFKYIRDMYPHLPVTCLMKNYRKLFQ